MPDDTHAPAATTTTTAAPPDAGQPDTREPSAWRQAELRTAYDANLAAGNPPYAIVGIRARDELQWILRERDWSVDFPLPPGKQRPDLRGADLSSAKLNGANLFGGDLSGAALNSANLSGANLTNTDLSGTTGALADLSDANLNRATLSGANLSHANLSHANLSYANLSGARLLDADLIGANLLDADLSRVTLVDADLSRVTLVAANLSGATLLDADLSEANLGRATLSGAALNRADLSGADLSSADLSSADLSDANLSGADLSSARMDAATSLADVRIDRKTRLGDVVWNGVPLTRVPTWPLPLGDETPYRALKNRKDRITAYRDAARAYRGLSIALRAQGLLIPASNYRLREQILERKASLLSGNLLGWVFSWLLFLVAGYGERPVRSFFAYLLVLFGFAGAYLALGTGTLAGFGLGTHDAISTPLAALVFSVTSFHGRGFFPGGLALDDPITVLAALEAVTGLFIEITFIATFTQRFFGGR